MRKLLIFLSGVLLLVGVIFVQDKMEQKKEKIKVKVEKNVNGKKEVFEKEIDVIGMFDDQKNEIIDYLYDFFGVKFGKNGKMKIMIDEDFEYDGNDDFMFECKLRVCVYKRGGGNFSSFLNDFEFDMEWFFEWMKDVYVDLLRRIE